MVLDSQKIPTTPFLLVICLSQTHSCLISKSVTAQLQQTHRAQAQLTLSKIKPWVLQNFCCSRRFLIFPLRFRQSPSLVMSGLPSDEVAEDYKGSLEDLVSNDRYQISNMTLIAKENIEHAEAISRVLQNHVNRVCPFIPDLSRLHH